MELMEFVLAVVVRVMLGATTGPSLAQNSRRSHDGVDPAPQVSTAA